MKEIIGIKLCTDGTRQEIEICSQVMRELFRELTRNNPVTYSQILFPYVDALSLTDINGAEGTHIFGTHALFCGISSDKLSEALSSAVEIVLENNAIDYEFHSFDTVDGAVRALEITEFMMCSDLADTVLVGNFCELLSGYMQHWQIRESAKVFASFVEMAYRKSAKKLFALSGGRAVMSNTCENIEEVKLIYSKKTGYLC